MSAEGKAAGKAAEHVIAKAVEKAGVRDAEQVLSKDAAKTGARAADGALETSAAAKVIDPHTRLGPSTIDHSRPGGDFIPRDYDRFGGKPVDDFIGEHWNPDHYNAWNNSTGDWRYPPNEGFKAESIIADAPVGTRMDRYGGEGGDFTASPGTSFPQRALPPDSLEKDYHVYETVKPFDSISGYPQYGETAPAFGQSGGGMQYKLPRSVQWLRENGYLREVSP